MSVNILSAVRYEGGLVEHYDRECMSVNILSAVRY